VDSLPGQFAEDSAHSSGHTGNFILGVRNDSFATAFAGTNGDYTPLGVDSAGRIAIAPGQEVTVVTGAVPLDVKFGNVAVHGTIAHDGALNLSADRPVGVGLKASQGIPAAVSADTDATFAWGDRFGRVVTAHGYNRNTITRQNATMTNSTAETTLLTAGGAGVFLDVVALIMTNASATDTRLDFRDSTGGSVLFSVQVPTKTSFLYSLPQPLKQATANNNWTVQSSASVNSVSVTAIAHQAK
jgi:hypothetical protein